MDDQLNRRDLMQRLNAKTYPDAEKVSAWNQFKIDHPHGDGIAYLIALCAVVLAVGICISQIIHRPEPAASKGTTVTVVRAVSCSMCHVPTMPPLIKGAKHYKRYHQHPNADDIRLARQFKEDEEYLSVLPAPGGKR